MQHSERSAISQSTLITNMIQTWILVDLWACQVGKHLVVGHSEPVIVSIDDFEGAVFISTCFLYKGQFQD